MVDPTALSAVALQLAAGLVAGYGTWRCLDLQQYGKDPRLRALSWFFGLFAASVLLHALWEWQIASLLAGGRPPGGRPVGIERVTVWLLGHHLLMTASLAVGVVAFGRKRPDHTPVAAAVAPLLVFSNLVPLLLSAEAALTLYLAVRAWLNHMERRSPGALQVAMGFLLFFIGHLLFLLSHRPGQGRQGLGDVLTLVGIVLLVQVLPGRR